MAFTVYLRGIHQPRSKGKAFEGADAYAAFNLALAVADYPMPEPVIDWQGLDELAVLDVDYHGVKPWMNNADCVVDSIQPQPRLWWESHGGGIKLVFTPCDPLTAKEQAAIARMVLRQAGGNETGIEIMSRTRHPRYPRGDQRCGELRTGCSGGLIQARSILLGDIDTDAEVEPELIEEWLEENGLTFGQRLEHSRCPIEPYEAANDSVAILDRGIYCHRCEAKGACYPGCSKPGFAPWRLLIGIEPVRIHNNLRAAVRGRCHWTHAKHFIKEEDKAGYQALLKLQHVAGQEKHVEARTSLVDRVFFPVVPIVRGAGCWLYSDTLTLASDKGLTHLVESLPGVLYVTDKGKLASGRLNLGVFLGGIDLAGYGYPAITPIRGADIAQPVRPHDDMKIYATVAANPPFRYRVERDMVKVESTIESCYPTVNLNLLRLLIAAKGLVQRGELVDIPQVFITGQSGSGKSAHSRLAAEIACDRIEELRFVKDQQRQMQGYADASDSCSFALYNEASKSGITGSQLRDFSLSFSRGIKFHKLYVGPRRIDQPAVVIMTDPSVPDELRLDAQTARRIALVDLGAGVNANAKSTNWYMTCQTGSIDRWRSFQPGGFADVADAFLSEVICRYFRDPTWTFRGIVNDLGFKMMEDLSEDVNAEFLELYGLIMALPEHDGSSRWKEPGWRVFDWQANDRLAELYRDLTDEGKDTQAVQSARWGIITGVLGTVCKIRPHRRKVGFRFKSGQEGAAL
jgi:hypothetical protein